MKRIEFKLTMPGRNTWNGKWSGDERNYTIVKSLKDEEVSRVFDTFADGSAVSLDRTTKSWFYRWPDGWSALVTARIVPRGERLRKSDGFNGYEWMIASILQYGKIYADHERPELRATEGT
jgi:hypothetical protein